ncbi:MAG: RNA-binding protein [Pseudomonadales bacterium]|nr:RNA-binding protein [Pseudomonadales bacterium]
MSETDVNQAMPNGAGVRIDRWLWAARFFKTRSLAKTAIEGGKVHADGQRIKPAKEVRIGQTLEIRRGDIQFEVVIVLLSEKRGPAAVAQTLYRETEESIERREADVARRRMERAGLKVPDTRPSKKQRRDLRRLKTKSDAGDI